jgi:hypothetical protein
MGMLRRQELGFAGVVHGSCTSPGGVLKKIQETLRFVKADVPRVSSSARFVGVSQFYLTEGVVACTPSAVRAKPKGQACDAEKSCLDLCEVSSDSQQYGMLVLAVDPGIATFLRRMVCTNGIQMRSVSNQLRIAGVPCCSAHLDVDVTATCPNQIWRYSANRINQQAQRMCLHWTILTQLCYTLLRVFVYQHHESIYAPIKT